MLIFLPCGKAAVVLVSAHSEMPDGHSEVS